MHTTKLILALLLVGGTASAQPAAPLGFQAVAKLAGSWRGTGTGGHPVEITFRLLSGNSAVSSELVEPDRHEDMMTVFHRDRDRLLMTHYCSAGNQPRMQGTLSSDGKTIVFEFIDATNLPSPNADHMRRLVIRMLAQNHHTEAWTYVENGRESTDVLDVYRVTLDERR
jgi:hypothetical protein